MASVNFADDAPSLVIERGNKPAAVPANLLFGRRISGLIPTFHRWFSADRARMRALGLIRLGAPGLTSPDRRQLRQISASRAASASARFFSTILWPERKMLARVKEKQSSRHRKGETG